MRALVSPTQTQRSPACVAVLKGPNHVFDFVNDRYASVFGARGYVGHGVLQIFPELREQSYPDMLNKVFCTGQRVDFESRPIKLIDEAGGGPVERLLTFSYIPTFDAGGSVTGGLLRRLYDVSAAAVAAEPVGVASGISKPSIANRFGALGLAHLSSSTR